MHKWFLRKVKNKYELYCLYDDEDDDIPILSLMRVLENEYDDIIIQNEESDIMNGIYTKNLIINSIEFSLYEELYSLTFSSNTKEGDAIIYYISTILKADMQ
ncbi:hypothetical protein [Brachyspira sp.]|uniref:hypothetical protein n=1 Tax=Brachyspira sp. TaxID=1977261 RepID=UPI0026193B39|nr:hypothetical protein [Brachyspira sp.]